MTPQEIRDAITASPELQALAAQSEHGAIASALSGGAKIASHFASERGILERYPLGPVAGDELIAALEAFALTAHPLARIVGRALKFLGQPEGLDIGSPATLGLIDQLLAGGVLTQEHRDGLRQMATVTDIVTVAQVIDALKGA